MTQDEIILLADASGISLYGMGKDSAKFIHYLEAFAKLVAKHTLMNIDPSKFMSHQEGIEAGRIAEREACAELRKTLSAVPHSCVPQVQPAVESALDFYAERIRARGEV